MAVPDRTLPSGKGLKHWVPLAVIGLVVVAAGLLLPQMLPEAVPAPTPAPSAGTPSGNLSYSPPAWPEPPSYQSMFLRLGLGTAAVLALCVGTLWVGKRWLRSAPAVNAVNAQLHFLETLPLGNRCCVHLIHVANRPVLVGADASGIKTLVPLPDSFASALRETQEETSPTRSAEASLTSLAFPGPDSSLS